MQRNKTYSKMPYCVGLVSVLLIVSCSNGEEYDTNQISNTLKTNEVEKLSISNKGLEWHMQFGGCRVFIVGDNERKIMKMPNPPRDFLLSCLERPNSFQAAHILLSFRYLNLKEIEGGVHIWNGLDLFLGKEDDTTQIKKLTSYWHEKLKAGELEDPNPVLHEDYLKILFRIPVPEPQEVQDAKTLEATNPPPRGAEGGSGSEVE